MIAVDCEFSFDDDNEFVPMCADFTQEDGQNFRFWRDEMDKCADYIKAHKSELFIGHNIENAECWLWCCLGLRPTEYKWADTLLMSRAVYNRCSSAKRMRFDLASCLARECQVIRDHEAKKADQLFFVYNPESTTWEKHLAKVDSDKAHAQDYCHEDTENCIQLFESLNVKLSKPFSPSLILDRATPLDPERRATWFGFLAAYMGECSWRGIPLNKERVQKLVGNAKNAVLHIQQEFERNYPETFRLDVEKGKYTKNENKCREYAAAQYGANAPRTASGQVSLASEYTKEYEGVGGFLWDYHEMDKQCRALASFTKTDRNKNWLGHYLPKRGIIRPRINLLSAVTGRCGSKPSSGFIFTMGKAMRGLIDPPEGWVVCEEDFSNAEIFNQAALSGDQTMLDHYLHPKVDDDYYTTLAVEVFHDVPDKRDTYKVIALMSNYGCGEKKLADVSKQPLSFCRSTLRQLQRTFRTYWRYDESCIRKCQDRGYIAFSDGWAVKYDRRHPGKATTLINWPFQGVGALVLRKMLFYCWREGIRLVAPVHDALIFLAPEDSWEETAAVVKKCMLRAVDECIGPGCKVGETEVTYHGIVNCHSGFSTREQYEKGEFKKKVKKYYNSFNSYLNAVECQDGVMPDTENLYLDENKENLEENDE